MFHKSSLFFLNGFKNINYKEINKCTTAIHLHLFIMVLYI